MIGTIVAYIFTQDMLSQNELRSQKAVEYSVVNGCSDDFTVINHDQFNNILEGANTKLKTALVYQLIIIVLALLVSAIVQSICCKDRICIKEESEEEMQNNKSAGDFDNPGLMRREMRILT